MPKFRVPNLVRVRPEFQLKFRDVFDFKAFYDALHDWLNEHDWVDVEDKSEHYESHYGEKVDPSGSREIWIRWRPFKAAPDAPFLHYYLDFNWHIIALTNTEIIKDGKKFKVNKGEVELKMTAYVEEGYKNEFAQHTLLKHVKNLFSKRLYKKEMEQRKKELYQEVYEMNNFIKQWLKLKRYHPYEETQNYYRSSAWPSHIKEE